MSIVANVMSDVFSQVILTVFLFTMSPLVGVIVLVVELIAVLVAQPMLAQARRNSDVRQRTIECSSIINFPPLCPAFGTGEFRALLKVQMDIKPLSYRVQLQGFDKPRRRYA